MDIYGRIKSLRENLNMTQEELAKKMGYKSRSTINKIEKGLRDIGQSQIIDFADALGVSPAYLMGWEDEPDEVSYLARKYDNINHVVQKSFPMLGEIACGEPMCVREETETYISADNSINADFCLKCKGDSMIDAKIDDGDIVFIKKQSIVDNGEIAAVIIENEATLKRVYYYRDKNLLILRACNIKYNDLIYSGEELDRVNILGKAVYFQSIIKN